MPDERPSVHSFRFPPFHTDKYEILGSTDEITGEITALLSECLNLRFYKVWDKNRYVLGFYILPDCGEEPPHLRAVRHWDKSDGLDIMLEWLDERPSEALIEEYRAKVTSALETLSH